MKKNEWEPAASHSHVTMLEPPIEIAEARVDVPIYVTTCETIGNYEKGIIPAHVQKDFNKKVEHALQVFADTLEASFKEGEGNVEKH